MNYDFDRVTDRTGSFAIKYDLAEKRGKPRDAISLWVADMDFPTAPCIRQALADRAEHGIFGYSRPDGRYYAAVRKWFRERHGFLVQDEWVVNAPGVVFAIATAIKAFTKEGEGVLIQRPVYYPFFNVIRALGRKVVNSPLRLAEGEDGLRYEMDFEDLERKVVSEQVKLFVFCSPHNPGGRVWTRDELVRLEGICRAHGVLVLSDEIHSDITFGTNRHTVYATLSEEAAQHSIICTSPSKTFNLAGLQFSNIFIPNPELRQAFQTEQDRTGYDEPSLMGIIAATAAYAEGGDWFDAVREYIWQNVLFVESYLSERCPRIHAMRPEGSYLLWLDFSQFTELTDGEISRRILHDAKVWLDNGRMSAVRHFLKLPGMNGERGIH